MKATSARLWALVLVIPFQQSAQAESGSSVAFRAEPRAVASPPHVESPLACKEPAPCGRAHGSRIFVEPGGDGPQPREGDDETDVQHYFLDIELIPEYAGLDITAVRVAGVSTITVRSLVDGLATFTVDLAASLNVSAVTGNATSFTRSADAVVITLDQSYNAGDEFQVAVSYSGHPAAAGFGAFQWWIRNGQLAVATLSEPYYARFWWPCKDSLGDKATMQMHCTVPDPLVVASNGVNDGAVALTGARTKYRWHETHPMVPYLASLAVTAYQVYQFDYNYDLGGGPQTMPLVCYLYSDHWDFNLNQPLPAYKSGCDELPVMLDMLTQRFGPYPFLDEKYGVAETGGPGGLSASMEHQTISSMARVDNFSDIMAHELAHHWWGDEVTCATWFDIWINEGFASYSECLYREIAPGGGVSSYWSRVNARRPGNPDGRVYRTSINTVGAIFSTNDVYNKGCWVLHMLRRVMGDSAFFAALADYRAAHADGFASTADFADAISASFGHDLAFFTDQWVMNPGSPRYEWNHAFQLIGGQRWLKVRIRQMQNTLGYGLFRMPIDVRVTTTAGIVVHRVWNDDWTEHYVLPIPGTPTSVELDEAGGVDNRQYILASRTLSAEPVAAPPVLVSAAIDPSGPAPGQTAVTLAFSENIGSLDAADVSLTGALSGAHAPASVSYDALAQTAVAAWSLLPSDDYTLTVLAAGISANSMALDGEIDDAAWYDDLLLPSGDGQPGGNAVLDFALLAGDADCDGSLATADIAPFVAVLLGLDEDPCHALRADMNNDGTPDGADLQPFVDALLMN